MKTNQKGSSLFIAILVAAAICFVGLAIFHVRQANQAKQMPGRAATSNCNDKFEPVANAKAVINNQFKMKELGIVLPIKNPALNDLTYASNQSVGVDLNFYDKAQQCPKYHTVTIYSPKLTAVLNKCQPPIKDDGAEETVSDEFMTLNKYDGTFKPELSPEAEGPQIPHQQFRGFYITYVYEDPTGGYCGDDAKGAKYKDVQNISRHLQSSFIDSMKSAKKL